MDILTERINDTQARGEYLAESKWAKEVNGLNGRDAACTAIVLENTQRLVRNLWETTRAQNVANFDRYAFPLVRAVYPSLIAHDLVSTQPMDGPTGLIFFFDIIYGTNKGRIRAGTPMFSSETGHPGDDFYSSPRVEGETLGNGNGVLTNFTGNFALTPVVAGTISLTDGTQVISDDGRGNLVGDINPGGTNTINYETGAFNVTMAVAIASGQTLDVDYEYDNEANSDLPEVDFQLTSFPVTAKTFKLKTQYSLEAAQNLRSTQGLSAETELVVALAEAIRFEIDRTIIKDVNSIAQADTVAWPQSPPSHISFTEHKLSLVNVFTIGSNNIFKLTRRGQPNWIVAGIETMNTVESLPNFVPSDNMKSPVGVVHAGTLGGRWRVYKDPYNIDNTTSQRNFLIGFKGNSFLDAGYVYAPYVPFYTTPTIVLPDFVGQKGMATSFGRRKVNGRFFCQGSVVGSFAP